MLDSSSDSATLTVVGRGVIHRYQWPLPTKPKIIRSDLSQGMVLPSGISPDGRFVAFHNGGRLEVLDTVKRGPISSAPQEVFKTVLFSPDSTLMAAFNKSYQHLMLFDLQDAQKYQYKIFDKRRIIEATFSNDGRFLYTCNLANEIVVWDLVTMGEVKRIKGHDARIKSLASPKGELFALASGSSGSDDRSVIFWNLKDTLFPPPNTEDGFDLDLVWADLGSKETSRSLTAVNQLSRALQNEAGLFGRLAEKFGLTPLADGGKQVAKLINDLDDQKYSVREKATIKLAMMADQIRPLLERTLVDSSQEAKWRIQRILRSEKQIPLIGSAEGRRKLRVFLSLELCRGRQSMQLLRRFVESSHEIRVVSHAQMALSRLEISALESPSNAD